MSVRFPCGISCFLTLMHQLSIIIYFDYLYSVILLYCCTCSNKRWKWYVINDWTISCISSLSLFLTWLLDSMWSLHVYLHFQSTECWQNLQLQPFETARLCTEGLMSSFSVFFANEDGAVDSRFGHAFIVLKGEGLSLWRFCFNRPIPTPLRCIRRGFVNGFGQQRIVGKKAVTALTCLTCFYFDRTVWRQTQPSEFLH